MNRQMVLKACVTFFIQVILSLLVWKSTPGVSATVMGGLYINAARLIAASLLHYTVMPEIKHALGLMQYSSVYSHKFDMQNSIVSYMLGCFKLSGGVLC